VGKESRRLPVHEEFDGRKVITMKCENEVCEWNCRDIVFKHYSVGRTGKMCEGGRMRRRGWIHWHGITMISMMEYSLEYSWCE
jgi:hypothetical protein